MDKISIQQQDFDLGKEISLLKAHSNYVGAMVSFIGVVRDLTKKSLSKMILEHYPGMTEKSLQDIINQARSQWKLENITIIHRVGELLLNDQIVLVIVTSRHRKSAFESCEFIMDFLKTKAPFWKKEYVDNIGQWVEAKEDDFKQSKQWILKKTTQ